MRTGACVRTDARLRDGDRGKRWYHGTVTGRAALAFALVTMTLVASSVTASAQPQPPQGDMAAARDAYDRGAASYDAGEYALAAQQLSRADAIVANDVALELALKAAVKANDALLTMDLAARADTRQSPALLAARDDARAKMGPRTGRVTVFCAPRTAACTATFDDGAFPVNQARWVLAGEHRVVVIDSASKARQAFRVRVDPAAAVEVVPSAIPAFTPAPANTNPENKETKDTGATRDAGSTARRSGGLAPAWFYAGLGVTTALGVGTVFSAVDTQDKHDRFVASPSRSLSNDGADAQVRTNVLIGATAVSAVVSAAVGLFFVRWGASASPTSTGGGLGSGASAMETRR